MNKFYLMGLLLIITACGQVAEVEPETQNGGVGTVRELGAGDLLSEKEVQAITQVCEAFAVKRNHFEKTYINKNKKLTFNTAVKKCTDEKLSAKLAIDLKLVKGTEGAFFKAVEESSSKQFYFSEYETDQTGLFHKICEKVATASSGSDVGNYIKEDKRSIVWFGVMKREDCSDLSQCLHLEFGRLEQSGKYKITESDKLYINNDFYSEMYGLVYKRERFDQQGCLGSEFNHYFSQFVQ